MQDNYIHHQDHSIVHNVQRACVMRSITCLCIHGYVRIHSVMQWHVMHVRSDATQCVALRKRTHTHCIFLHLVARLASSETTYSVFVISRSPTLSTSLQIPRHKVLPFRRPSTQDSTPYLCPCIMLHHVCTCYTTRNTTQCIGVYLIHGILYICIHTMRSIVLHHLA